MRRRVKIYPPAPLRGLLLTLGLGAVVLGLSACGPNIPPELPGRWQGVALTEAGDSVAVDPAEVEFTFTDGGRYFFQSTLNYREAGHFRMQDSLLITLDTTRQAREKAVQIRRLTLDTLIIRMLENERERLLTLRKH